VQSRENRRGIACRTNLRRPAEAEPRYRSAMRSAIFLVLGVLVALAGLLFTLQGFGAVSGSPMSNTTTWSILGPVIALIGIAIAFAVWRARK